MRMRGRTQVLIGVVSLTLSASVALVRDRLPHDTGNVLTDAPRRIADILLPPDSDIISAVVPNGTTVAGMLGKHLLPESELSALVQAVTSSFDVRRLRAGNIYRHRAAVRRPRPVLRVRDRPDPGPARQPARRRHRRCSPPRSSSLPRTTTQVVVEGRIDREAPSLSEALEHAGERLELALAMAEIFGGEIDFNSDLQPGDAFRLVVEKSVRDDGQFVGYGPVQAAEFVNDGRALQAMRFVPDDGKAVVLRYRGPFAAPLLPEVAAQVRAAHHLALLALAACTRVLNYARAHNGVDYGAPSGAPVMSVSAGVVSFAGWTSGGGRTVRVRHTSGYESEYMHLSAIAAGIRPGARVGQGELVGNVGRTGLATAPHLHYGLRRDGRYVNPITEHQNLPPGEPVPAASKAAFDAERDTLFAAVPPAAAHAPYLRRVMGAALAARGGSGGAAPRAAMRADLHPNVHNPHVGGPEDQARRQPGPPRRVVCVVGWPRISDNIRGRSNDASRGPRDAACASWGGTRDAAPAECRHQFHHGLLNCRQGSR